MSDARREWRQARRRALSYVGLGAGLTVAAVIAHQSTLLVSQRVHVPMEVLAAALALVAGLTALVRHQGRRSTVLLCLGIGLVGAGLLGSLHILLVAASHSGRLAQPVEIVAPASAVAPRLFLALMLLASWLLGFLEQGGGRHELARLRWLLAAAGTALLASAALAASVPWLLTLSLPVARPQELLAALPLLLALIGYLHKGRWRDNVGEHCLVLALIVILAGQALFLAPAGRTFGLAFGAAHLLEIVAHLLIAIGLMGSLAQVVREVEATAGALESSRLRAEQAEALLRDAIEAIPHGFVIWDRDDRLLLFNRRAADLYPHTGRHIRPGMTAAEVAALVAEGDVAEARGREQAWIAERLQARALGDGQPRLHRLTGGRLVEVRDTRASGGALVVLHTDVTEARRDREALEARTRELSERIKEIRCLYAVSRLLNDPGLGLEDIYRASAAELEAALQFPETAGARIVVEGRAFEGRGYAPALFRLRSPILVGGAAVGEVEVVYREPRPEAFEGPFLAEERELVDAVARKLGHTIAKRRAEAELHLRDQAIQQTSQGTLITDNLADDQPIIFCNHAFEAMTGYQAAEILGRNCRFLQGPGSDPATVRAMGEAVRAGRSYMGEILNHRKDGSPFWNALSISPIQDRDGRITHFVGVQTDITARKRAEEELRASERQLARSQQIARVGTFRWEPGPDRVVWSAEMYRLWGIEEGSGPITRAAILEAVHEEDRPGLSAALAAALESREALRHEFRLVRRDDGELRHMWTEAHCELDEQGGVRELFGVCQDISERVRTEHLMRHMAQHDALTDLPNRTLFGDRLARALAAARRREAKVAVLCLDLNDFKGVNDTLGHAAGDEMLRQVAQRLRALVREADTVARLGGDEFAIIQSDVASLGAAAALARRIVETLALSMVIDGQELFCTASVGIALYPDDALEPQALLRHADMALYRAKASGRGAFQFFLPEMNEELHLRKELERELRQALARDELALVYQPQFDLWQESVVGIEALLRWPHPERGLVPPDRFVPVAEDCGLIVSIGEWVLRKACRQARAWRDAGLPPVRIAVNLSPSQFLHQDLVETVTAALDDSSLPPLALELEITEGALMHDTEAAVAILERLRALGIAIAVDDFGTGYSSLGYLKRFPIDKIKIDRSFVVGIPGDRDDAAIARAVVTLGHSLGLRVIAEGVETAAQVAFLKREDCDEAQGYYFSPPLAASACAELVARRKVVPRAPSRARMAIANDHSPFHAARDRPRTVSAT